MIGAVLELDRTRTRTVAAPADACLDRLRDVAGYAAWASLVASVDVVGRDARGTADDLVLNARVLGLPVVLRCRLEPTGDGATLRRIPFDADDDERYVATWSVAADGEGCAVTLHVAAALDAPGAARFLRGRVEQALVDDLLDDFAVGL